MSTSEPFPSPQNVPQDNDLRTFDSIKKDKETILDVEEKLEPQVECCIYRVPKDLRKINEQAYTPQVVSIGPLHYGKGELSDMEKQKIRFVREFSKRIKEETWQEFINFIENNEPRIRNCYAEMPNNKFKKFKFTTMILYDAVFIIEYLLRYPKIHSDFLMSNLRRVRGLIWTDLLLLENQLPYFVLEGLYMLAFLNHGDTYPTFFQISFRFVYRDMFDKIPYNNNEVEFKHFTDLRRYFITKIHHPKPKLVGDETDLDLPCAVKLHKSGVKFKSVKVVGSESFLDIRVQKKKWLKIPCLNYPELQIPHIGIYDETECLFRNLMALEMCHYSDNTHVCSYIDLMDNLINNEEDVNLLLEANIISNCVGDTDRIAKMFNKLCLHIELSDYCYYKIQKELQTHYKNGWNHAKATLKRVYFTNLWRGTATIAAILLLVLTLIQTICTVMSVV